MEFKITVGIYLDKNQKGCEIVCAENYKIIALDGMVQAYSKERISYQPLGWRKEFRGALRSALSELRVTEKQCLITSYYEPEMGSFDLENILFYNIGVASFRQIATKRIFAENCSQQKASESDKETEFSHRYTYKICDSETHRDFWANRILAAEWDPVPVSGLFSVNKVVDYWQTLRDNPDKIKSYLRIPENPFGVKIKLSIPKTKTVNLT
ncbi:MAG TPA: hypothetical protein IAA41_02195, partial [Candidatus Eubacterium faecavium]|nr:hypothetical protein [Candidatus Eubacterium faecavium]